MGCISSVPMYYYILHNNNNVNGNGNGYKTNLIYSEIINENENENIKFNELKINT